MSRADGNPPLGRLPRGRHGLPRETVTRSQRERLLAGVVQATAAKGYAATTIADILEQAGVGRETFYELFADKRDCMLAAHRILFDQLEAAVRDAYEGPGEWAERMRMAIAAALGWYAADPAASKFMLVELAAIGPLSRDRFQAEFDRFVSLLDEGLPEGADPALSQATGLAVSAALARIYEEVLLGRAAALPNLLPQMTYELLVPFLGEEAARAEQQRAQS